MEKEFDRWNLRKQEIDLSTRPRIQFHEREIWWCAIGINIGSEQHSQTGDFSRPIIVFKRWSPNIFWGIPLTTKLKSVDFRFRFTLAGIENDALIVQLRAFDSKRLLRKVGTLSLFEFKDLQNMIMESIQGGVIEENETPPRGRGISEAEATVLHDHYNPEECRVNNLVPDSKLFLDYDRVTYMATTDDVKKLAALARITVPEEKLAKFAEEFEAILGYVSQLDELVVPQATPLLPYTNVFRADEHPNETGKYTEKLAEQFPTREGDLLSVKQIVSHD